MGTDDVRDSVLDAARAVFNARGYVRTSVKGVAAAAGVAPEVVNRYWQSKESLFAAAMQLPFDPAKAVPALMAPGLDGMGERLTRAVLDLLADEDTRADIVSLYQVSTSTAKAARGLQAFLEQSVVDRLVGYLGVPDARLRVNLILSYLLGVGTSRYVLRMEPLASMSEDEVVRLVAPTVQALLDPSKPLKPAAGSSRGGASAPTAD